MAHPFIKQLGITPEIARDILTQLREATENNHHSVDLPLKQTSSQWCPEHSLCFVQHYISHLSTSHHANFSTFSPSDWRKIRDDTARRFPTTRSFSDGALAYHVKLLTRYLKVAQLAKRMFPNAKYLHRGKFVFDLTPAQWKSIQRAQPRSQQRYVVEFANRIDNRDVNELCEWLMSSQRGRLGVVGARVVAPSSVIRRIKRRTI